MSTWLEITCGYGGVALGVVGLCVVCAMRIVQRESDKREDLRRARRVQADEISRLRCKVAELQATNLELQVFRKKRDRGTMFGAVESNQVASASSDGKASARLQEVRTAITKTLHPDANPDRPAHDQRVLEEAFTKIWPVVTR